MYADGVATTRRELQAIADRIGAEDLSGQAIGVLMPNAPAAIAAWFGIWRAGGAFVPLNPRAPDAEIERAIERTGVAAVMTPDEFRVCRPASPRRVDPE